jgi:hypothetical protein
LGERLEFRHVGAKLRLEVSEGGRIGGHIGELTVHCGKTARVLLRDTQANGTGDLEPCNAFPPNTHVAGSLGVGDSDLGR